MIFDDLEELETWPEQEDTRLLAVGWLGASIGRIRVPSSNFLDALFLACLDTVQQTRGFHPCSFCEQTIFDGPIRASRMGRTTSLGSAEVWVPVDGNIVYAAPDLIYHYVETHHYAPPEEFVSAVLAKYGRN